MEEAAAESENKGWCGTDLSTNYQIDELEASIAKLIEDMTVLTQAIADLDAAMAKATFEVIEDLFTFLSRAGLSVLAK